MFFKIYIGSISIIIIYVVTKFMTFSVNNDFNIEKKFCLKEILNKYNCSFNEKLFKRYSSINESKNVKYLIKYEQRINKKKFAIFSLAYNYTKNKYFIFINTLLSTNFKGDLFFFVSNYIDIDTLEYLRNGNSNYIRLDELWPYYSKENPNFPIENEILHRYVPKLKLSGKLKFIILRYIMIYVFLLQYKDKYEYILSTDMKDVIFQKNPFGWNYPQGVVLFEESRTQTMKENRCNLEWINNINKEYAKLISNFYILNGGIIYCSVQECVKFFKLYSKIANDSGILNPNDQSIINIIAYLENDGIDIYVYLDYFGPVRTMAVERGQPKCTKNNYNIINNSHILTNEDGVVLNIDGSIPHILHTNSISITDPHIMMVREKNNHYSRDRKHYVAN